VIGTPIEQWVKRQQRTVLAFVVTALGRF